jgi:hypothetical protein
LNRSGTALKKALSVLCVASAIALGALPDELAKIRKTLKTNPVSAKAMVETLLAGNAASAPAHSAAGDVAFRSGEFERADQEYRTALKLDPQDARALRGQGRLADICSYRKTAKKLYARAYSVDPDDSEILRDWAGTQHGDTEIAALERYLTIARDADQDELDDVRAHLALHRGTQGRDLNRLTSPYKETNVKLAGVLNDRQQLRGYAVDVRVNALKPMRLLLDTGASGVILNRKAGRRAKLDGISASPLRGVGDDPDKPASVAIAKRLTIGDVEFSDYVVRVSDGPEITGVDGVMGTDVLQQFSVRLNLPKRTMTLVPFRTADGEPVDADDDEYDRVRRDGFVDAFRAGSHLLIPGSANESGPVLFLIDSGAYNNVVSRDFAAQVSQVRNDYSLRLSGIAGQVRDVYKIEKLELHFADIVQHQQGVLSIDFSKLCKEEGVEVAGLLGFPTLADFIVELDYRNGLVRFTKP